MTEVHTNDSMTNGENWPHDGVLHAWWVQPGHLLAGEYPGHLDQDRAEAKLRLLINSGIGSIIDLTDRDDRLTPYRETLEAEAEKASRTVHYFSHPNPDLGVADDAGYDAILDRIKSEQQAGRIVYIHCWGGVGRTCTVIACLLCDQGMDYDSALARIARLRAGTRKASRPIPESSVQRNFLRARCAHRHL